MQIRVWVKIATLVPLVRKCTATVKTKTWKITNQTMDAYGNMQNYLPKSLKKTLSHGTFQVDGGISKRWEKHFIFSHGVTTNYPHLSGTWQCVFLAKEMDIPRPPGATSQPALALPRTRNAVSVLPAPGSTSMRSGSTNGLKPKHCWFILFHLNLCGFELIYFNHF